MIEKNNLLSIRNKRNEESEGSFSTCGVVLTVVAVAVMAIQVAASTGRRHHGRLTKAEHTPCMPALVTVTTETNGARRRWPLRIIDHLC